MGGHREPRGARRRRRPDRPGRARGAPVTLDEPGYTILSLDELPRVESPTHGGAVLLPLRHVLGLRAFGANAWTAPAGGVVVPPHEEDSGNEELYVVVRGLARFTVAGETLDATAGTLVHVPPGTLREAVAGEQGTIVLAVGGTPGAAWVAHGWDDVLVAWAYGRAGRVEEGRAVMAELASRGPEEWYVPYNLACYESSFGDRDAAFAHLARAIALNGEEARRLGAGDDDLAALRADPRWQDVVG